MQQPDLEDLLDPSLANTEAKIFSAVASWFDSIQEYQFEL
jgi:hypothetical protein